MTTPLPTPPAAVDDENSIEMLSAWIANEGLHCSLNVGIYQGRNDFEEETAWGILLADVAGHLSDALEKRGFSSSRKLSLEKILRAFQSEIQQSTSERSGGFQ